MLTAAPTCWLPRGSWRSACAARKVPGNAEAPCVYILGEPGSSPFRANARPVLANRKTSSRLFRVVRTPWLLASAPGSPPSCSGWTRSGSRAGSRTTASATRGGWASWERILDWTGHLSGGRWKRSRVKGDVASRNGEFPPGARVSRAGQVLELENCCMRWAGTGPSRHSGTRSCRVMHGLACCSWMQRAS